MTTKKTETLNLFQKLIEVKKQVPYLKKDARGYNFNYANPEAVLGALNPLLNEAGVFLKSEVLESSYERMLIKTKNGEKYENLFVVKMKMTFVNVDNPEERDENLWASAGINGDEQGFGSALTYGERYFMLKYFNIPTGADDPDSFVERAKDKATTKKEQQRNYTQEAEDCKTLDDLGAWWGKLSIEAKKLATGVKNNRKSEIEKTAVDTKENEVVEALESAGATEVTRKEKLETMSVEDTIIKVIGKSVDEKDLETAGILLEQNRAKTSDYPRVVVAYNDKCIELGFDDMTKLPF